MIKCPVCGKHEFENIDDYRVCPVCGWENEEYQRQCPNEDGGANRMSLNQARAAWKRGEKVI
ncbi:CPCC family cysteine-rich protein [Hornefia butyriciproducens]|uniref:CPCC family cysteine-rich protein n=1 Tax=Hornefia butyriciproducens TaxID=2652293 RepID=UPI0029FE77A3|nr:CPCC family cysteine-rich protein [Hornefia butyriciproducens]MCI7327124.1 hypothetical protein [Clostridiales bacterium]MDD7020091.1 CPCC family cysteine-rich protein [Hornefia butyriciproducens]MDY2990657.1 CPCC family cysteine-rich protein [Hornefia butyriciproducens]MDY5424325.1 CPCC family cysteine-rich protein [Hornefia butyriciproducens]